MRQNRAKFVVFIMGPTASGKTALALSIAQKIPSRIISVDSTMIYQTMNIGSAKPPPAILRKFPHHLIDILPPEENYSAAEFINDAHAEIETAHAEKTVPILVGGTAFYFRALEYGLSKLPKSTLESRRKIRAECEKKGVEALYEKLKKIDAKAAKRIHKNDTQRIKRALEVFEISGKTLSELQGKRRSQFSYPLRKIILMPPRDLLHQKIEERFLKMLDDGFMAEMKTLFENPKLSAKSPAMRAVGYRQAWQFLAGEIDFETMRKSATAATRQLCKRQTTWLRGEKNALVLPRADLQKALDFIRSADVSL